MAPSRVADEYVSSESLDASATLKKVSLLATRQKNILDIHPNTPKPWVGSQLVGDDYIVALSDAEEAEVAKAAREFIASRAPLHSISSETFPLRSLGPRLIEAGARLRTGLGFFVLRGLRPDQYDSTTNIAVFLGVSSYLGNRRAIQYKGGPVLAHVVDLSSKDDSEKYHGEWMGAGNRNTPIPFHTDLGHTLCLYSLYSVPSGGRSRLASSKAIIDTLENERPDVVELLKKDWQWDTLSDDVNWVLRPLLLENDGKTLLGYSRRPLLGCPDFPRRAALDPLTERQTEALALLEKMADKLALNFDFNAGDIQYINNLATLHGREGYERQDIPGCRRHLLRISIKDEEHDEILPEKLENVLGPMYDHDPDEELFPWHTGPLPYSLPP